MIIIKEKLPWCLDMGQKLMLVQIDKNKIYSIKIWYDL